MKAISLKASRGLDAGELVRNIAAAVAAQSTTIAVIGAAVCFAAALAGDDTTMFAGAFAALAAVRTHAGKGGEA